MIEYNSKDWFRLIFRITHADTFRKLLPLMLGVGVYAAIISYVELNFLKASFVEWISNIHLMHDVLGFALSLLLVFRTNTAYDRWWEGRKVWNTIANRSRSLAMKLHAILKDEADKEFFRLMIPNFAFAVKNMLRQCNDLRELEPPIALKNDQHIPNQIAAGLFDRVNVLLIENKLTVPQSINLNEEIKELADAYGACEKIKNTPIPFTYSVFIKKFIFFYVMTLPFGWVFSLGYFVIPVVILILFAFGSLELIAEEIEEPFGTDANDLPIDQICQNIRKQVGELLY